MFVVQTSKDFCICLIMPVLQSSRSRRKLSSEVFSENKADILIATPQAEPWTILAHKKPQNGWIPYNPRTMRPPPPPVDTDFVKLMSWNVNGLRALLKLEGFSALELAQRENFDVLCLQETKLQACNFLLLCCFHLTFL